MDARDSRLGGYDPMPSSTSPRSAPAAARSRGSTPAARSRRPAQRGRRARAPRATAAAAPSRPSPTPRRARSIDPRFLGRAPQLDPAAAGARCSDRRRVRARHGGGRAGDPRHRHADMVPRGAHHSVRRGYDPRELALVAFGGAARCTPCEVATHSRLPAILLPPAPASPPRWASWPPTEARTASAPSAPRRPRPNRDAPYWVFAEDGA